MLVEITNSDILMAEKILFGKTGIFSICEDDSDEIIFSKNQRIKFIKDLRTLDLRAVPGSGKTTALLAKLLILESKFPFDDGSGVLVLSHTNAAVDEIKRKIEHHCPKLFHYPNFVGTIQSFVDQFLAIPFYTNKNDVRPYRIDNEIHSEYISSFYSKTRNYSLKGWLDHNFPDNPKDFLEKLRFDNNCSLVSKIDGTVEKFKLKDQKKPTYIGLSSFKTQQIKDGILHFDDAYFLANRFISIYLEIITLIQRRFKFVFVDEMQDMDKHQVDLLEKLFFNEGKSKSIYQRIGDKNQAIHNDIESEDCWKDRIPTLEFTGSHRLNPFTAKVVQPFCLYPIELHGLVNSNVDFVKPHLIVYEDPKEVLPKFERLIKEKNLDQVKTNDKYPFRAIGWVGPYKEFGNGDKKGEIDYSKHVIRSFFVDFKKDSEVLRTDYTCLTDYITHFDSKDITLASIQKNILNAIVKALREAGILDEFSQRPFSVSSFLKYFKEKEVNEDAYNELKLKLYDWSFSIVKHSDRRDEIEAYIRVLIEAHFKKVINERVTTFLSKETEGQNKSKTKEESEFIYSGDNGIKIKIGTIHSVKGETHVATLVFDTFYEKFNSLMLSEPFRGDPHGIKINKPDKDKQKKQTAKMLYVAFSRPTHLLCFAIHKDRYSEVFINGNSNFEE